MITPWEFKNKLKKINEKKEDQQYSYGCVMGYFNDDVNNLYKEYFTIDEDDIYNNEEDEYGLEIEPHVTLLYGLHEDVIEDEVIMLLQLFKELEVSFDSISLFENEKFDVLKWDIGAEKLSIINDILKKQFDHTESFPDYHPHCTIAYLKPGTGKKYITEITDPITKPIEHYVYSMANGKKISIVGDDVKILRLEHTSEMDELTETIKYYDYDIKVMKNTRFNDSYYFSVYENKNYLFGFKGSTTYNKGLEDIKKAIDSKFGKEEKNK